MNRAGLDHTTVTNPSLLDVKTAKVYTAQAFCALHPEFLPCQENLTLINKWMDERRLDYTLETLEQAYEELKDKILPPFQALRMWEKKPEEVLEIAEKYGIPRPPDAKGKVDYDWPEAWRNQPFVGGQHVSSQWESNRSGVTAAEAKWIDRRGLDRQDPESWRLAKEAITGQVKTKPKVSAKEYALMTSAQLKAYHADGGEAPR